MEIQKEREAFEATSPFSIYMNKVKRDGNKYTPIYYKDLDYAQIMSFGWLAWQATKSQAVPEGFVVVAKELPEKIAEKMAIDRIDKPIHENDPVWSEIAEESYKNQVKLKKWEFWRDYKAMIEAQEQSHECQNP